MDRHIRTGSFHAWLALTYWVVVMALAAISLFLRLWNAAALNTTPLTGPEYLSEVVWWLVLVPAAVPAYATVGAIIAARRPGNGIGWLLLLGGFVIAVQDAAWQWATRALAVDPGSLPGGIVSAWLGGFFEVNALPFALLAVTLLLFPNGTLPSRLWRLAVWMAGVGATLAALSAAFSPTLSVLAAEAPNPLAIRGLGPLVAVGNEVGTDLGLLALLVAVASVFLRWRRAGNAERQQLKWLAYTAAVGAVATVGAVVSGNLSGTSYPTVLLASVAIASATIGVPVAIGFAILRYRLYDVDLLINKTLVYGALTATLACVYFGGIVLLQDLFRIMIGQETQLAIVASTLLIATLFNPLRRRIQNLIDRSFYRKKYDAQKILEAFSSRLRDETDLEVLTGDMVSVIRETLQPEHISLWLRAPVRKGGESDG